MKIVVLDGYGMNPGDLSWDGFMEFADITVFDRTSPSDVVDRAKDADAILTNKVVVGRTEIGSLPNLKYIGVLATGYNVVDLDAARERGIVVTNIPAYSTDSVVQMTFAHILNIVNRVDYYANQNRKGRWSDSKDFCYWDYPLREISNFTLGVVGLGNIGMKVARIASGFGMEVYAATSKNSANLPDGIKKTTLEGLFGVCDIITLHCPLSDKTREMINSESIARMKQGAVVVNTGRGQLVNEADVAEALHSGRLSAYAADVMCQEPPKADNPLFACENAFITPHIAWATFEARKRLMKTALSNVRAFADGKPQNVVG